jgi:hypothetical protein
MSISDFQNSLHIVSEACRVDWDIFHVHMQLLSGKERGRQREGRGLKLKPLWYALYYKVAHCVILTPRGPSHHPTLEVNTRPLCVLALSRPLRSP